MNICLVTSSFHGGGITSFAHEIICNFSHDNILSVVIGDDKISPIDRDIATVYNIDSGDTSYKNAKRLLYLLNKEIRPDVVINSNSKLLAIVSPYLNDEIRIITVSHSLKYFEADVAVVNNNYVDKVISLSNYNKSYFIKHFNLEDNKTSVVYNFISELPDCDHVKEEKKYREVPIIVYPGGMDPPKSPEIVVQIVKALINTGQRFKFYWVGPSSFKLNRAIPGCSFEAKELLPLDERLVFTGRLSREDANNLFANSNVFLFPSVREGCSISLLEAMRGGSIPIVADYDNGNKEMVTDGHDGFVVNHDDIDAFVSRILQICKGGESISAMYDQSIENWRKNYTFGIWLSKMERIILSTERSHEKRKPYSGFSFLRSKILVSYLFVKSKIELFFFERVRMYKRMKSIVRK